MEVTLLEKSEALATQLLKIKAEPSLWRLSMKVKCDSVYATFLGNKYKDRVWVRWDKGLMTVWLTLDLSGICEE